MPEILDIIDPSGDVKEQLEAVRNNFLGLTKQTLKLGTYILADSVQTATQTISATSYTPLTGFTGSFQSSGGPVLFDGSFTVTLNNLTCRLALFVDGEEKGWGIISSNGAAIGSVIISRWLSLNAGNHKYEIKARVSGSSAEINDSISKSTLSIVEFLRG